MQAIIIKAKTTPWGGDLAGNGAAVFIEPYDMYL